MAAVFAVGENVLATDSGLLYDAKVLKAKHPERGEPTYFIHFNKWNSRWDKWVTAPSLRKQTDENREMQRKMKQEADVAKVEAQSKRKLDRVKEPKIKAPKAKKPRILDNDLVRMTRALPLFGSRAPQRARRVLFARAGGRLGSAAD